jgi:hypothetical protein
MSRRNFLIFLLTATFLISAWGNVIAAAFCPGYANDNGSVSKEVESDSQPESESCHHETAQVESAGESTETENAQTQKPVDNGFAALLQIPNEPCGHCWTHSQPSSRASTVAALSSSPRSAEANPPPSLFSVERPFSFIIAITPLDHGPPGNAGARYLLNNVFRI